MPLFRGSFLRPRNLRRDWNPWFLTDVKALKWPFFRGGWKRWCMMIIILNHQLPSFKLTPLWQKSENFWFFWKKSRKIADFAIFWEGWYKSQKSQKITKSVIFLDFCIFQNATKAAEATRSSLKVILKCRLLAGTYEKKCITQFLRGQPKTHRPPFRFWKSGLERGAIHCSHFYFSKTVVSMEVFKKGDYSGCDPVCCIFCNEGFLTAQSQP